MLAFARLLHQRSLFSTASSASARPWTGASARRCAHSLAFKKAEAHSLALRELLSDDGIDSVRLPEGTAAAWSHGPRHQGGVGLIFKNDFLTKFYPVKKQDWVEPVPGRVAARLLWGEAGDISIASVYLPSGRSRGARRRVSSITLLETMNGFVCAAAPSQGSMTWQRRPVGEST